jgi:hypothetical protein
LLLKSTQRKDVGGRDEANSPGWQKSRRKREVEKVTENEREAWKPLRIERKQSLAE